MRLLTSLVAAAISATAAPAGFHVLSTNPNPWPEILGSVGFHSDSRPDSSEAGIFVLPPAAPAADWPARVEKGAFVILEGESAAAEAFGFRKTDAAVRVASVTDVHAPKLSIVWQSAVDLPRFEIPKQAQVFARERWSGAPLVAGFGRGSGAVLWLAASPGPHGYERFPYILQALADLGLEPPVRSARLWAFFDSSYRMRVDPDYFAARWRAAGISALHIAAWHFFEPDAEGDAWLRRLIDACHRQGILTYAWLDLPHVSEKFWTDHPAWREQTALLQDAQLDWRKLMNLRNRDCFRAVSQGVQDLLRRFDWDGVNLAELYFESLEGAANPAHFTPMNREVRDEFRQAHGFDPLDLFQGRKDAASLRAFLDYRADLARRMQAEWVAEIEKIRPTHPDLHVVLTHIDDRFDRGMRDALGADVAATLPLLDRHSLTLLVEDPATVWNLGPARYAEIARRYREIAPKSGRLAIDINIVERYQDVYPTRQQTGTELFELVHQASASFPRVALYFENSIAQPDWKLLPAAATSVARLDRMGDKLVVESAQSVGIPWQGAALVDGEPWPVQDEATLWLPPGTHIVEPCARTSRLEVTSFNGDLKSARVRADAVDLGYESDARALAVLSARPQAVEVDGAPIQPAMAGPLTLALPKGRHRVTIR
jgi:hypothetical protein